MNKNFWKMTTIGLVGYVIGRERRTYTDWIIDFPPIQCLKKKENDKDQ